MRFSYFDFLTTTLFSIPYFTNILGRHVLFESSANGGIYSLTDSATLLSHTLSSHSSVQPSYERNSSSAISRNTTGFSTFQTFESSSRGSGAVEPTGPATAVVHDYSTGTPSSSLATDSKLSPSSNIDETSQILQDSQTTTLQTSSAIPNIGISSNTTSTLTLILTTPSNKSAAFTTASGQARSQGSAHAPHVQSIPSNSSGPARSPTSSYTAAVLNNGSLIAKWKSWSANSSTARPSNALPVEISISGLTDKITSTWGEWTSSRTDARTARSTGNQNHFGTTAAAKVATTSITHLSSGSTGNKTSLGSWPASISFCSLSDGVAVVEVGFVTTLADGKSSITNTSPSQSLITASAGLGCAGEVAVFSDVLTTTIQLSTLPSATSFPQDGVQAVTQSGAVVQYSPETLSGFNNAQPVEISTNFVEVINGHTTTQGGWWLIGAYGQIEFPKDRPWKTGKGIGCIGGPALCNMPCGVVDVGLDLFVHIDHKDCTPDETGPPGFPGGLVSFGTDPDPDPDPPYPQEGEGEDDGEDDGEKTEDPEKKTATNKEESTERSQDSSTTSGPRSTESSQGSTITSRPKPTESSHGSTITSRPRSTESSQNSTITSRPRSIASSSTVSSASHVSSSSASATQYMIVAAVGADQTNIEQALRKFDPEKGGSYAPDVGDTSVSGGTWVYYELAPYEVEQLSSRSDILGVVTCTTVVSMFGPGNSPSGPPQTVDATVSLETLDSPSSATLSASVIPKRRRDNAGIKHSSDLPPNRIQAKNNLANSLQIRDAGTRLVRQRRTAVSYSFPPMIALFVVSLEPGTVSSFRAMSSGSRIILIERC